MTDVFDEDALRHWLVDYLVTNIGCSPDEIDLDAPLNDLAVGSSDAVVLTGELSELLGRTVSPVEFWQYPTINALAKFLTGGEVEPAEGAAGALAAARESGRADTDDAIAVIGLGLRLPGGSDADGNIEGPDQFWEFLTEGRSAVREVPADRWESFRIDSPEAAAALAGTTRWGSFLRDVDAFDAEFFEISPSEADKMDPQQRLLLEVTHEALEHAGIPAHSLRHTQTGVFAAACLGEYGYLSTTDLGDVDSWSGTGGALSIIANRVSYYFDLRGPSMTIDTACSSSLVTIHLACQSLRAGDSDVALAAGVNMVLSPAVTRSFDQLEAMSKTGQCHAFDAAADGFVRGEGAGVAVLKRLSDAQRDGDRVLAVIRGSAVNQDGRSNGLMAPNPAAQMAVLRSAYAAAGVEPREVDYVEAHGTGTLLGDPIEARALGTVLGKGRPADRPLLVGAVKSNLGHLEAAAGIAGFAKAVLALQHNVIPANLGYQNPNPHIPFDNLRLRVVAEHTDWAPTGRPRRAGISSFGFGGTNAHVVIEEAPRASELASGAASAPEPAVTTLVVTGRTPERVAAQAGMLATWMAGAGAEAPLAEVAHALNHHRSHHNKFGTVVARDRAQAVAGLQALATGQSAPGVNGPHVGACTPGTVFVYSGQGSQWAGMGRRLLADEPAFAAALAEIEPVFVEKVGFSLHEVIAEGRPVSGDAEVQPVLMGLQLALTELWRSYGVHPDAVIGHSMGEVTAAVVAGALSLADGLAVIAARSSIMSRLAGQGAVALVELDPDAAEALVADYPSVEIAGLVSPRQTVVAGLPDEVDAVIAAVGAQDRFARRVNMEVASHTALMDPVLPDLRDAFAGITPRTPSIPFLSTVRAGEQDPVLDADYWVANVRQPVQFSQAVTAAAQEIGTFVEISPNPILTYAIADTVTSGHHHALGTLVRDGDDTVSFHTALNATHTTHPPEADHPAHPGGARIALPITPWHRTRHWAIRKPASSGATAPRPGTVLGGHTVVAGPQAGHLWQARLTPQARPYPHPHRFAGVEIVPLSVVLQTLAMAADRAGAAALADVRFEFPIALDAPKVVQVYADADIVSISSATGDDDTNRTWVRHVIARIDREPAGPATPARADVNGYDPSALAELHHAWGIEGLAYPWTVSSHAQTSGEARTEVTFADAPEAPLAAALDAAVNLGRLVDASTPGLMVPSAIEHVVIGADPAGRGTVVTRHRGRTDDALVVDLSVESADGTVVADLRGIRYTPVDVDEATPAAAEPRRIAHRLDWQPVTTDSPGTDTGPVAVVGSGAVAAALRQAVGTGADVAQARTVVYVADSDGPSAQETAVRLTTEVADLVATLADREPRNPATLWLITHGVRESATESALRQSPLWGLAGVIGAEQPQLWGGLIDVPETDSATDAAALAPLLGSPVKSVAVWRDGALLTPTLAEIAEKPTREPLHCRPDAAYLITGGMGVLGLLMADWLADRGARRIVLAGRTALPPRREWAEATEPDLRHKIDAIRALELRGVSVDTVAVDIADRDAVAAVLDRRDADGAPPIRGVIHAAGMTEAQLLTELEPERVHRTVWPKIAGAQVLADLFPPQALDFLYLAASAGAVFGVPGQGAYAAGNAYLDALARARHAQGDNTVSLDWVAWRGLGFGSEAQVVVSELERVGSRPVAAGEAFAAWDHVTRFDIDQVVMAPMDSAQDAAAVTGDHRPAAPTRNWAALDRDELLAELRDGLRGILATELRLPESDVLTDRPFAEMGLNSVMAMSIRREIERLVGLELSATMLFNHPTIDSFAGYLAQQLNPEAVAEDAAADGDDDEDSLLDSLFDSVESN